MIPLKPLVAEPRPHRGWIRAIRDALGMTNKDLAKRIGVSPQRIHQFERGEVEETIKLDTLRRVAAALDCDLVYFLVPRQSLADTVHRQALRRAQEYLAPLAHHSRLEDQEPDIGDTEAQLAETAEELIDRKGLWS